MNYNGRFEKLELLVICIVGLCRLANSSTGREYSCVMCRSLSFLITESLFLDSSIIDSKHLGKSTAFNYRYIENGGNDLRDHRIYRRLASGNHRDLGFDCRVAAKVRTKSQKGWRTHSRLPNTRLELTNPAIFDSFLQGVSALRNSAGQYIAHSPSPFSHITPKMRASGSTRLPVELDSYHISLSLCQQVEEAVSVDAHPQGVAVGM